MVPTDADGRCVQGLLTRAFPWLRWTRLARWPGAGFGGGCHPRGRPRARNVAVHTFAALGRFRVVSAAGNAVFRERCSGRTARTVLVLRPVGVLVARRATTRSLAASRSTLVRGGGAISARHQVAPDFSTRSTCIARAQGSFILAADVRRRPLHSDLRSAFDHGKSRALAQARGSG